MDSDRLVCRSDAFSLPPGSHYLNCAYMGPLPRESQQAGIAAIGHKANPSSITPADFFSESDEVRRLFAELINGDATRIAIIPAVSYGAATVARNTPLEKGQNIVVVGEDFPSDAYAWRRTARKAGVVLRVVAPPSGASRGAAWNDLVLAAIDSDTAVVAVPHVHWTDGTRFDLMEIGRAARASGGALIVDATQSIGALPFDVQLVQADAVICAGYKWLLGPYSTALAYFGPRYDSGEPIEENWIARKGSENFQRLIDYEDEYAPGSIRYDGGQRSNFILLPMLIASLRLLLDLAPERVQQYCEHLIEKPVDQARDLGFLVEEKQWRGSHLFGLRAPEGMDSTRLSHALQARNVSVSLRGSAIRVSPHVYNTEEDLDALIQALRDVSRG